MNNIVIDTSVVIKWFLPEQGSRLALKLKDDHLNGKIRICSRELLLYEFASSFKNYSKIKLDPKDFAIAVKTLASLKLAVFPLEYSELGDLYVLAKELNISVYDCSYLLLAKKLKTSLYTADKKLYISAKTVTDPILV